ncbi:MAG: leucine-rich repeat domain-containing protein [Lachnospiraceae bacterium]|nr:leucine-rich repeat domain-containing protein [Lachnospiraceae bacterium]
MAAEEGGESKVEKITIRPGPDDVNVIPDKYNTGCKGTLTKFAGTQGKEEVHAAGPEGEVSIFLKKSSAADTYNIDFNDNGHLPEEVLVKDMDFSAFTINMLRDSLSDHSVTIRFENCRFGRVSKDNFDSKVLFLFDHCTIRRFIGSNAILNRCAMGGSNEDPLVPFRNVEVAGCYFSDLNYPDTDKVTHIDGTQIYGYRYTDRTTGEVKEVDVQDVSYENCRFEVPNFQYNFENKATVNSCIMIQLEYADAYNIKIKDCIVNGGGYTIFARSKKGDRKLEGVSLENVRVGDAKYFGAIYPTIDKKVRFSNLCGTDSLYIGTVEKLEGKTTFSVTNDTRKIRKLRILTDKDTYDFAIPAGATRESLDKKHFTSFSQLPADRIYTIPEACEYAICLDVTDSNNVKQIRFVNYTDGEVVVDKSQLGNIDPDVPLASGTCKEGLTYTISKDYTLTVSGNGIMEDFHSGKLPLWDGYKDYVKKVVVEDGVQGLGNMAFRNFFALEEVVLPDSLKRIGARCFANCNTLSVIDIPEGTKVEKNAFVGVAKIIVEDQETSDEEDEELKKYQEQNKDPDEDTPDPAGPGKDEKQDSKPEVTKGEPGQTPADPSADHQNKSVKKGDKITDEKTGFVYQVTKEGKTPTLSLIRCPKKKKSLKIKSKITIDGQKYKVTSIGKKAFRNNKKVQKITLEKGITKAGKGAFKGCKNLKKVIAKDKKLTRKKLWSAGLKKSVTVSKK